MCRRIVAAKTFLLVNNLSMGLCAVILGIYLWCTPSSSGEEENSEDEVMENPAAKWSVVVISILLCTIAKLASAGTVILMQKDWIVVIANGNNDKLAGTVYLQTALHSYTYTNYLKTIWQI